MQYRQKQLTAASPQCLRQRRQIQFAIIGQIQADTCCLLAFGQRQQALTEGEAGCVLFSRDSARRRPRMRRRQ